MRRDAGGPAVRERIHVAAVGDGRGALIGPGRDAGGVVDADRDDFAGRGVGHAHVAVAVPAAGIDAGSVVFAGHGLHEAAVGHDRVAVAVRADIDGIGIVAAEGVDLAAVGGGGVFTAVGQHIDAEGVFRLGRHGAAVGRAGGAALRAGIDAPRRAVIGVRIGQDHAGGGVGHAHVAGSAGGKDAIAVIGPGVGFDQTAVADRDIAVLGMRLDAGIPAVAADLDDAAGEIAVGILRADVVDHDIAVTGGFGEHADRAVAVGDRDDGAGVADGDVAVAGGFHAIGIIAIGVDVDQAAVVDGDVAVLRFGHDAVGIPVAEYADGAVVRDADVARTAGDGLDAGTVLFVGVDVHHAAGGVGDVDVAAVAAGVNAPGVVVAVQAAGIGGRIGDGAVVGDGDGAGAVHDRRDTEGVAVVAVGISGNQAVGAVGDGDAAVAGRLGIDADGVTVAAGGFGVDRAGVGDRHQAVAAGDGRNAHRIAVVAAGDGDDQAVVADHGIAVAVVVRPDAGRVAVRGGRDDGGAFAVRDGQVAVRGVIEHIGPDAGGLAGFIHGRGNHAGAGNRFAIGVELDVVADVDIAVFGAGMDALGAEVAVRIDQAGVADGDIAVFRGAGVDADGGTVAGVHDNPAAVADGDVADVGVGVDAGGVAGQGHGVHDAVVDHVDVARAGIHGERQERAAGGLGADADGIAVVAVGGQHEAAVVDVDRAAEGFGVDGRDLRDRGAIVVIGNRGDHRILAQGIAVADADIAAVADGADGEGIAVLGGGQDAGRRTVIAHVGHGDVAVREGAHTVRIAEALVATRVVFAAGGDDAAVVHRNRTVAVIGAVLGIHVHGDVAEIAAIGGDQTEVVDAGVDAFAVDVDAEGTAEAFDHQLAVVADIHRVAVIAVNRNAFGVGAGDVDAAGIDHRDGVEVAAAGADAGCGPTVHLHLAGDADRDADVARIGVGIDADGPITRLGGHTAVVDDGQVAAPVIGADAGRRAPIAVGHDVAIDAVGNVDGTGIVVAREQAEGVVIDRMAGDQAVVDGGDAVVGLQLDADGDAAGVPVGVVLVGDNPAVVGEVQGSAAGFGIDADHFTQRDPTAFGDDVAVVLQAEVVEVPGEHAILVVDGDVGVQLDGGRVERIDHGQFVAVPRVQGAVEVAGADHVVDDVDADPGLRGGRGGGRGQAEEQRATQRFHGGADLVGAIQAITGFGLACHRRSP